MDAVATALGWIAKGNSMHPTCERCSLEASGGGTNGVALPGLTSQPQNAIAAACPRLLKALPGRVAAPSCIRWDWSREASRAGGGQVAAAAVQRRRARRLLGGGGLGGVMHGFFPFLCLALRGLQGGRRLQATPVPVGVMPRRCSAPGGATKLADIPAVWQLTGCPASGPAPCIVGGCMQEAHWCARSASFHDTMQATLSVRCIRPAAARPAARRGRLQVRGAHERGSRPLCGLRAAPMVADLHNAAGVGCGLGGAGRRRRWLPPPPGPALTRCPCAAAPRCNRSAPPPTRLRCCRVMASAPRSPPLLSRCGRRWAAALQCMAPPCCCASPWAGSPGPAEAATAGLARVYSRSAECHPAIQCALGAASLQALTAAGKAEGEEFAYTEAPIGGAAIDGARWLPQRILAHTPAAFAAAGACSCRAAGCGAGAGACGTQGLCTRMEHVPLPFPLLCSHGRPVPQVH